MVQTEGERGVKFPHFCCNPLAAYVCGVSGAENSATKKRRKGEKSLELPSNLPAVQHNTE